jgi:hypothetical protein
MGSEALRQVFVNSFRNAGKHSVKFIVSAREKLSPFWDDYFENTYREVDAQTQTYSFTEIVPFGSQDNIRHYTFRIPSL